MKRVPIGILFSAAVLVALGAAAAALVGAEGGLGLQRSQSRGDSDDQHTIWTGTQFLTVGSDRRTGRRSIYASRRDTVGSLVEPFGVPLSRGVDDKFEPAAAVGPGGLALVAWEDTREGASRIYGTRLAPSGQVLDPQGLRLSGRVGDQLTPTVTFDGQDFFVFWADFAPDAGGQLYGNRISPDGGVFDPAGVWVDVGTPEVDRPTASFDGTSMLLAWEDFRSGATHRIHGARVASTFTVVDVGGVALSPLAIDARRPSVAAGPTNGLALVGWDELDVSVRRARATLWNPGTAQALNVPPLELAPSAVASMSVTAVANDGGFTAVFAHLTGPSSVGMRRTEVAADGGLPLVASSLVFTGYGSWGSTAAAYGNGVLLGFFNNQGQNFVALAGSPADSTGDVALAEQSGPATAWNGSHWLAAWEDGYSTRMVVNASRRDRDGGAVPGVATLFDDYTGTAASVAANATSNWYVGWRNDNTACGRRVGADGSLLDPNFTCVFQNGSVRDVSVVGCGTDWLLTWDSDTLVQYRPQVWGTRISSTGAWSDGTGTPLVLTTSDQSHPRAACAGTTGYSLVWEQGSGSIDIRLGVVPRTGAITALDGGVKLSSGGESHNPVIAEGVGASLVVWEDQLGSGGRLKATLLFPDGGLSNVPGALLLDAGTAATTNPSAVWDGNGWTVAYRLWVTAQNSDIWVARFKPDLQPAELPFAVSQSPFTDDQPNVSSDGQGRVMVSYRKGADDSVPSRRVYTRVLGIPLELGRSCSNAPDCASGFCVDGVCCDGACGQGAIDCQACSVATGAAIDGTCGAARAQAVCRPALSVCDYDEVCDGLSLQCGLDRVLDDGASCGVGICFAGICRLPDGGSMGAGGGSGGSGGGSGGTGGGSGSGTVEFTSTPPTSASCNAPLLYTPTVNGQGPTLFRLRGADGNPLPDRIYLNPDTGEVLFRPTSGGPVAFELVATTASGTAVQRVLLEVKCDGNGLGVRCGCGSTAFGPLAALLGLWGLVARRRRR